VSDPSISPDLPAEVACVALWLLAGALWLYALRLAP
jgi:hypothetical protein